MFRSALALVAAAIALLVIGGQVDWNATRAELSRLGARAAWTVVPYFVVLLLDTVGWQATFERKPPLWRLWRIRTATEAVSSSVPAGVAFGESLRVVMVRRATGLSGTAASANAIVTKFGIALAQVVFVLGALLGAFVRGHGRLAGGGGARLVALAVAGVVASWGAFAAMKSLSRARALGRTVRAAQRVLSPAARSQLDGIARVADEVDDGLASFANLPGSRQALALAWFLLGWVALAGEDWIILSFLTPGFSFAAAARMEGLVSLVRIGFFFVPGALGAQEVSYFGLIRASGVASAAGVAAAFVLLKRVKELVWIAIGYGLLAVTRSSAREQAPVAIAEGATPRAVVPSKEPDRLAAGRQSGSRLSKGRGG